MSEVARLISDMVRAGVDPDLIGRTAAVLAEREPVKIIDEQAERRRAKDRERKRLRNSAESAETLPPSLDKESSPHTPLKEINPNPPISPQPPCRFDEFWTTYPRKIGKGQALKAWKAAIKKADPAVIISAITEQAALWKREDRAAEFIPHPSTWLNGERWADEVAGAEPDAPEVAAARARGLSEVYWTWPQNREWLRRLHQLSQGKGRWMGHWSAPPWEPGCTCPKAILEAFPEAIEFARGGDHVRAAE